MPPTEVLPSCESCGACCFGSGDRYVRVTGDDHARLGAEATRWTQFIGNRAYMRMTDGHCAALRLDPDSGRVLCSIYEVRPRVCRDLERGSSQCDAERLRKGDEAQRWVAD